MPDARPYPHQRVRQNSAGIATEYDVVIVGGGPAGLSAAIYLGRFNRSVLVVDAAEGRSTAYQVNENYLGFPRGIAARDLRRKGASQAARFGAEFLEARVSSIKRTDGAFTLRCGRRVVRARAVIIATGVTDHFPKIKDVEQYIGRSLFWCITCDGWKTRGKRLVLVGHDDEAATTAMQFLEYTDRVAILTNTPRAAFSPKKLRQLDATGIPVHRAMLASVDGARGHMRSITTDKGEVLKLDMLFNSQGCAPNIGFATRIGLELRERYIKVDSEQRTNIPHLYAAGDVTKHHAHQVVTAAHEGATAAQAANYDLYRPEQRD